MNGERPTIRELLDAPPTVDIPTAARWLGISRPTAYHAAREGLLPGALKCGPKCWRVATSTLLQALGIQREPLPAGIEPEEAA